ncbi:pyrroloquinoline quinone biosynthesis protein PqqF [Pseudomonas sp. GCM10022186]|uniref:pyrroloquinoline quinone biosynthesis protein PqqF n=1 Tax=Pseudomonas sp. GCM10022186 TaxID=3252650 RepID=UPI00360DAB02
MSTSIASSKPLPALALQLGNGLRVRLLQRPGARLAAALVDVAGGSHDEPAGHPGLAHFLEHLVFLGSQGFPPEDGLMPFVQGLGGRVNASTCPRRTRFFCEVPATHLEQALARLLDMLANPSLDQEALRRERQVLDAEYSARARDPATLCEAALSWALAPGHPLADFHAGNAASLELESPEFLPALQCFHRDHYQPARICLTLVGPQPLEQLAELARRHGEPLRPAAVLPEPVLPPMLPLRAGHLRLGVPGEERLLLAFVLELEGVDLEAATGFLQDLMSDPSAGGLQERLASLGLGEAVQLRLPYAHGHQGLLLMDFDLAIGADCARLEAEVLGWLSFLRSASPWSGVWEERMDIQRRKTAAMGPLDTAMAPGAPRSADVMGLLEQLRPERLIRLETGDPLGGPNLESAGFPLCLERLDAPAIAPADTHWRLPPGNPYLHPRAAAVSADSPVPLLPGLPDEPEQGALYLRWQPGRGGLPQGLAHGLQRAAWPVLAAAVQAGLEASLEEEQGSLALALLGNTHQVRQVAGDLLPLLQLPAPWALAQGPRLQQQAARRLAGQLPIRRLLQCLPDRLEDSPSPAPAVSDQQHLARFWRQARWQGLGIGDVAPGAGLPGRAAAPSAAAGEGGRVWQREDIQGEAALLLFYPLERPEPQAEAVWRLLSCVLEPAFHQRLRGELQLGYALACGFRQFGRHRGLLFAVQSPRAPVARLFDHIDDFLARQYASLAHLDPFRLEQLAATLRQQLEQRAASFPEHARQSWFDHLAGLPANHAGRVRQCLAELRPGQLLEQHRRLLAGQACHALANGEPPSSNWRIRG